MKTRKLLCILAVLCAAAQMKAQGILGPGPAQLNLTNESRRIAGSFTFYSGSAASLAFDVRGISYYRILIVPIGTVSSCSLSLDSGTSVDPIAGTLVSPTIGGILTAGNIGSCAVAEIAPTSNIAAGISLYAQITPTITGPGSVVVVLIGYSEDPWAH